MSSSNRSKSRPAEFAGVVDKILHLAVRIARGGPEDLEDRLYDLIEKCLLHNKEALLDLASERAGLDEEVERIVDEMIEEASTNLVRRDPTTGEWRSVQLFALPISVFTTSAQPITVPAEVREVSRLRDLLVGYGAPSEGLVVAPQLFDPEDIDVLRPCERYRLLRSMAPQHLVANDRIEAPAAWALAKPEPLEIPAGSLIYLDRVLLCACVQPAGDPVFYEYEEESASGEEAQEEEAKVEAMLAREIGIDNVEILGPSPLEHAIRTLANIRPAKKLSAELLIELAARKVDPGETEASLTVVLSGGEGADELIERAKAGGKTEFRIPIQPPKIDVTVRHQQTGEVIYETLVDLGMRMDLEGVAEAILFGLATAAVPLAEEHHKGPEDRQGPPSL